jgi:hypothetical protein
MPQNITDYSPEKQRERAKRPRVKGVFKLKKERKCNNKCQLFGKCLFQPLSNSKYEGKCALANEDLGHKTKIEFVNTLIGSDDEFIQNARDILSEIYLKDKRSGDPEKLRKLMYDFINLYKTVFGIKEKLEHSGKVEGGITINILKPKENEDN